MKLVIMTDCVNDLNVNNAVTSSSIFTLNFVGRLQEYFTEVFLISNEVYHHSQIAKNNIKLIEIKDCSKSFLTIQGQKDNYINLENIICEYGLSSSETIFLMFGYNYKIANLLLKLKIKFPIKLFTYIFDTHKGAISTLPFYKRMILNLYHKYGIRLIKRFDGVILFNKLAYEDMGLSNPFLISRIGIDEQNISTFEYKRKNKILHAVYTGSLEYYNGIELMINSFKNINRNDIDLNIYGDGTLRSFVEKSSNEQSNINYYGVVNRKEVERVQSNSDLLLNFRDLSSPVCQYAFPSKLIEYMASGVPVCSTKVIEGDEFENSTYILNDFSPKAVVSMLNHILDNSEQMKIISKKQIQFIKNNFTWDRIPSETLTFFQETRRDNGNG